MKVSRHDLTVNYEDEGSGAVLVMLHGAGLNLHFWKYQVDFMKTYCRVIRPDFRGHGETMADSEPVTIQALTGDVIALLDHLGIGEAVLMGHSMGGLVALFAAVDYPKRIKGVVVANSAGIFPPGNPRSVESRKVALKLFEQGKMGEALNVMNIASFSPGFCEKNPEICEWLLEVRLRNRPEDTARQWKASPGSGPPPELELSRVHCPALFVAGEFDGAVPLEYMVKAQQKLAGSQLVTLPAGHSTPVEVSGLYNEEVLKFLNASGLI